MSSCVIFVRWGLEGENFGGEKLLFNEKIPNFIITKQIFNQLKKLIHFQLDFALASLGLLFSWSLHTRIRSIRVMLQNYNIRLAEN